MKSFLSNAVYFVLGFLMLVITVFFFSYILERKINRNILNEHSVSIIGHSHPKTSVNDSLLSQLLNKDVSNYGQNGQSMFWSIIGARKLKHQGSKTFIIELTNSTYTTGWKTTDRTRGLNESSKIYYVKQNEWQDLLRTDFTFTTELILQFPMPKTKVLGKFKKLDKSFEKKIVKENNKANVFTPDFDDEIIHQFIKDNDSLNFIIFRAPQHPDMYDHIGPENENYFIDKFNSYQKYKNCQLMDFGHIYNTDSLFADLGHMNYKGATIFTEFLADTLLQLPVFKNNDAINKARTHNHVYKK
jgi:hypothetical protein